MRNYWMRIALGALAIFIVGMIGREPGHRGIGSVQGVVEGSGPLSIPLAFIPFKLEWYKARYLRASHSCRRTAQPKRDQRASWKSS